jgi:hypothetical protein
MREVIVPDTRSLGEYSVATQDTFIASGVAPFFSMRKLRLIYNELTNTTEFDFTTFDDFKHQVLNSVAPQLELNKWQAIAARR